MSYRLDFFTASNITFLKTTCELASCQVHFSHARVYHQGGNRPHPKLHPKLYIILEKQKQQQYVTLNLKPHLICTYITFVLSLASTLIVVMSFFRRDV